VATLNVALLRFGAVRCFVRVLHFGGCGWQGLHGTGPVLTARALYVPIMMTCLLHQLLCSSLTRKTNNCSRLHGCCCRTVWWAASDGAKVLGFSTQHFLASCVILVYQSTLVEAAQTALLLVSHAEECMLIVQQPSWADAAFSRAV
jgi:hypothetical protein